MKHWFHFRNTWQFPLSLELSTDLYHNQIIDAYKSLFNNTKSFIMVYLYQSSSYDRGIGVHVFISEDNPPITSSNPLKKWCNIKFVEPDNGMDGSSHLPSVDDQRWL